MFQKATEEEMSETYASAKRGPHATWPFSKMEVGDAIEITTGQYGKQNPQAYALTFGKQANKKFRTRKIAENTWRIWRIA